jgi:hypothetical protein
MIDFDTNDLIRGSGTNSTNYAVAYGHEYYPVSNAPPLRKQKTATD